MRRDRRKRGPAAGRIALACAGLAAALAGCGGATFDGAVYRGQEVAFQVPRLPAGWQRLDVAGAALAFRDEAHGATIALSGRCNNEDDVPLASLTQHLFLQFTEREVLAQDVVPLDGREALHTVLAAKLDGVPKKFDVWVMKKDGCVYDLLFIADPARFASGEPAFREVVRGFATLPVHDD